MWLGMGREVYVASLVGGQGLGVNLVLSVKVCRTKLKSFHGIIYAYINSSLRLCFSLTSQSCPALLDSKESFYLRYFPLFKSSSLESSKRYDSLPLSKLSIN